MSHLIASDPNTIRRIVDQASDVGMELVILSFGSGMNMENRDPAYQAKYKEVADYAKSKGITIGAYSLLASRRVGYGRRQLRRTRHPHSLRCDALPGSQMGPKLSGSDPVLSDQHRLRLLRERRFLSRRHMRPHGSSGPPRSGRFAMGRNSRRFAACTDGAAATAFI